ncbi:MAG: hypothetical protein Kow0074_13840 [Candidatus Zixiibacteriota bacterium]
MHRLKRLSKELSDSRDSTNAVSAIAHGRYVCIAYDVSNQEARLTIALDSEQWVPRLIKAS